MYLKDVNTEEKIDQERVRNVIASLEAQLAEKGAFGMKFLFMRETIKNLLLDYEKLVTTMVRESLAMIGALCTYIPHEELLAIKPQKIEFNGSDMVRLLPQFFN